MHGIVILIHHINLANLMCRIEYIVKLLDLALHCVDNVFQSVSFSSLAKLHLYKSILACDVMDQMRHFSHISPLIMRNLVEYMQHVFHKCTLTFIFI